MRYDILQIVILLSFTCCFVSFIWAIKGFFRIAGEVPFGTRVIQVIGFLFMVAHLILLLWPPLAEKWMRLIGLILYGISFALFWSCIYVNKRQPLTLAFSSDQPQHLTRHGPYRYVRHPFYLSYSLAWIAGIVATAQPWLLISMLVMGTIYYLAATKEERKFLASPLSHDYLNYRNQTGMFIPRLRRLL